MRKIVYALIFCISIFALAQEAQAQRIRSTKGVDFWFGMAPNNIDQSSLSEIPNFDIVVSAGEVHPDSIVAIRLEIPGADYESGVARLRGGETYRFSTARDPRYIADQFIPRNAAEVLATRNRLIGGKAESAAHLYVLDDDGDGERDSVNVFMSNWRTATSDASIVYPTGVLHTEYIAMAFDEDPTWTSTLNINSQILIVSNQDSTQLLITPSIRFRDFENRVWREAGETYEIMLDQGETYYMATAGVDQQNAIRLARDFNGNWSQVQVASVNRGLTGTRIEEKTGCRAFSVFAGSECASVGITEGYCDHLVEQVSPLVNWGSEYALTGNYARKDQQFRFLAADTSTTIEIGDPNTNDYAEVFLANPGDFVDVIVNYDGDVGSNEILEEPVAHMVRGRGPDGTPRTFAISYFNRCVEQVPEIFGGDPFTYQLAPSNLSSKRSAALSVINYPPENPAAADGWSHFANVILQRDDFDHLYIDYPDGPPPNGQIVRERIGDYLDAVPIIGSDDLVFATLRLDNGAISAGLPWGAYGKSDLVSYQIEIDTTNYDPKGGLLVYAYGMLGYDSYGYTAALAYDALIDLMQAGITNTVDVDCYGDETGSIEGWANFGEPIEVRDTNDVLLGYKFNVVPDPSLPSSAKLDSAEFYEELKTDLEDPNDRYVFGWRNVPADDYRITVIDGDFCRKTFNIEIEQPPLPVDIPKDREVLCLKAADFGDPANPRRYYLPDGLAQGEWCPKDGGVVDEDQSNFREYLDVDAIMPPAEHNDSIILFYASPTFTGDGGTCGDPESCRDTMIVYFVENDSVEISVAPNDTIMLPDDPTFNFSHNLPDVGAYYFTWTLGDSTNLTPVVASNASYTYPRTPGEYYIELDAQLIDDPQNCLSFGIDTVWVLEPPVERSIVWPNVFSPNGDGINDDYNPVVMTGVTNFYMSIYNRWGKEVFSTNNQNELWNGTLQNEGEEVPEGVYFWYVRVEFNDGVKEERTGNVTLLR